MPPWESENEGTGQLLMRWAERKAGFAKYAALVDGAKLLDECIAELEISLALERDALLTLQQASRESGLSADHLGRLVRNGQLANVGRKHRPRVRRSDLPMRNRLHTVERTPIIHSSSKRQIARDVVTLEAGGHDG
jgi:hypothetical protein